MVVLLAAAWALALGVQPAGADPRPYPYALCNLDLTINPPCVLECPVTDLNTNAVCFPAFHIQSEAGLAMLWIEDGVNDNLGPTAGDYCQDLNGDGWCGGDGEPWEAFCGSMVLQEGRNWDRAYPVYVYLHFTWHTLGDPLGCATATVGQVCHRVPSENEVCEELPF